jgi:NitT/TauT family transport system ATP-binding protein
VVSIEGVTKTFPQGNVTALQDIDLELKPGEFVSLIGPSGCGKSTLLRIIGDLIQPTSGSVTVSGKPASRHASTATGIVFQDAVLFDWRTVAKNMRCRSRCSAGEGAAQGTCRGDARARRAQGLRRPLPWQLSGGMQQRVDRTRTRLRACAPADGRAVRRARRDDARALNLELLSIWERLARLVVFVTHSISEAVFLSTRVVVMSPRPGRIAGIVEIDLPSHRDVETREAPRFFELVTEVRELLRLRGEHLFPEEEPA